MKDFSAAAACILLLDSEPTMRSALRDALDAAGYLVIVSSDLGEAVDRLSEIRPALLITRPYINSMPGRMAADYLRTRCPGLPVLIVGGFMEDDRVTVRDAVSDFHTFPKPFSREDLLAMVAEVLRIVRERNATEKLRHKA